MNFVAQAVAGLMDLMFPEICAGCNCLLTGSRHMLCVRCLNELPRTGFEHQVNNPVEKIFWGRVSTVAAMSLLYFTKGSMLQNVMHALKYKGRAEVGTSFGRMMGEAISTSNRFQSITCIAPVPMHWKKKRKRGYNQAELLCDGMSEILKVPVAADLLVKTGTTDTQTFKTRTQRWENMRSRFTANTPHATKQHVLLVDDVVTTGATLESCAAALLKENGIQVSIATLAFTLK
jgi:ComF family protein